jgi:ABC-type spermidine/putrescine transport system permease subunit II
MAVLAITPPDAYALGLQAVARTLGNGKASLALTGVSHVAWALPFAVAIMFVINSAIDFRLFGTAMELGASRLAIVWRVIVPLTLSAVGSVFSLGILFSLNEYTRASYLTGSAETLSQYIYGRMKSGGDASVYTISVVSVLLAIITTVCIGITARVATRISKALAG